MRRRSGATGNYYYRKSGMQTGESDRRKRGEGRGETASEGGSSIQSFHASKDNGGAGSGSLGREGMPTQIAEKNRNIANADLRMN